MNSAHRPGLLITEATAITHQGQGYADVPGLYTAEALDGWKKVTDAVHSAGGKIVVQMWHVGRISHTTLQPDGGKPVSASAIQAKSKTYLVNADGTGTFAETSEPRALELSEIPGIIEDYRKAARAAVDAGFDGVEIHAANGYLIDQFLRSGSNVRTDAYGGPIENRARFLFEVVDAITKEIGKGRTGIRISPVTPANDSSDPDAQTLFTTVVEGLARYKLSYIHVIEGATGGPRDFQQGDTPFDYAALRAAYEKAGGKAAWMTNNGYDRDPRHSGRQGRQDRPRRLRQAVHRQPGPGAAAKGQCPAQHPGPGNLLRRRRQGLHGLPGLGTAGSVTIHPPLEGEGSARSAGVG